MHPERLSAPAPAKINLVLEVLGRREDGFHEIDTVLQTLAVADTVTLGFRESTGPSWPRIAERAGEVHVTGRFAEGTPTTPDNLVYWAAEALSKLVEREVPWPSFMIDKHLPAAGGLGGGSSDAATTLRLLQPAWGASDEQLLTAAQLVGSDEAFFLSGGTARAQGRGERITPLRDLDEHGVVLFVPPATLERKTARLFAALGRLPFDDGGVAADFAAGARRRVDSAAVFNAFERVAFDVFEGLGPLWEEIEARVREPVRLAGAGPTLFWIGPLADTERVAEAAKGALCSVIATRTAGSLWR